MTDDTKIILASRSPRRAALLRQTGLHFSVVVKDVPENDVQGVNPRHVASTLARRKAEAVFSDYPGALVIGADTIVVLKGQILGKPGTHGEAVRMLESLSNQTHQVITAFTLISSRGTLTEVEATRVTFRRLTPGEIQLYVDSGLPMDKAGAYGIQDWAGLFVTGIEGCYYNVMGFPLARFYTALKKMWGEERLFKNLRPIVS